MEILFVSIVLVVAIMLLITERAPVDLTAIGIMVVLAVSGVLTPGEAVAGFANPAPITVGALFIVSAALMRTGATEYVTDFITGLSGASPKRFLVVLLVVTGLLSALINNTPVVVMFITIVLAASTKHGFAPSRHLMPLSFVSILAGTTTLIGTSTNIIVSDLGAEQGLDPIGMFELMPLGLPIAVAGGLLIYLLAFRILPEHKTAVMRQRKSEQAKFISELVISRDSGLSGKTPAEGLSESFPDLEVYEVITGYKVCDPETEECILDEGDLVLVSGTVNDLTAILAQGLASIPKQEGQDLPTPYDEAHMMVELIISPNSRLAGRRIANTELGRDRDINVVGVKRRGSQYTEGRLRNFRLRIGDIILAQMPVNTIDRLRDGGDVIVVEDAVRPAPESRKAPVSTLIFVGMILAASVFGVDILVASLSAAFLMIVTGCLSPRLAYSAVNVEVLILIIGTIALGKALSDTGAAELYAHGITNIFHSMGPRAILAVFIIFTSVMSHFISNNSAAVLLVPIAISTAAGLDVDPRPFLIGICFGASACYASPIGYQTNLLVYGTGKYHFMDFVKMGMPVNVLVWFAASFGIPLIWSF